jgi:hypothetical protein
MRGMEFTLTKEGKKQNKTLYLACVFGMSRYLQSTYIVLCWIKGGQTTTSTFFFSMTSSTYDFTNRVYANVRGTYVELLLTVNDMKKMNSKSLDVIFVFSLILLNYSFGSNNVDGRHG